MRDGLRPKQGVLAVHDGAAAHSSERKSAALLVVAVTGDRLCFCSRRREIAGAAAHGCEGRSTALFPTEATEDLITSS